ncbi:single stranded DNA-binding domain-containing protein [Arthrobacter sp. MDT3-24]
MADSRQGPPDSSPDAGMPVNRLPERGRVVCQGHIESVTYMPADRNAAFTAIVSDPDIRETGAKPAQGTGGRLRVVWLGRRRVPGIEAGTVVRLEGMLSQSQGLPTMFNPRYEILSRQENE